MTGPAARSGPLGPGPEPVDATSGHLECIQCGQAFLCHASSQAACDRTCGPCATGPERASYPPRRRRVPVQPASSCSSQVMPRVRADSRTWPSRLASRCAAASAAATASVPPRPSATIPSPRPSCSATWRSRLSGRATSMRPPDGCTKRST